MSEKKLNNKKKVWYENYEKWDDNTVISELAEEKTNHHSILTKENNKFGLAYCVWKLYKFDTKFKSPTDLDFIWDHLISNWSIYIHLSQPHSAYFVNQTETHKCMFEKNVGRKHLYGKIHRILLDRYLFYYRTISIKHATSTLRTTIATQCF